VKESGGGEGKRENRRKMEKDAIKKKTENENEMS
jgi:hypothetical protein